MEAELAVLQLLASIEQSGRFVVTPDRRDQREPGDVSVYVTTQLISSDTDSTLNGDTQLDASRVQINIFSTKKSDTARVARAIRNVLSGFRGEVVIPEIGYVFVCDCSPAGKRNLYSPPADGSEEGDYVLALDYTLTVNVGKDLP